MYREVSDVPGYKFLIDGEACAGIGKSLAEISVFVSKDGRKGRVLLFKYVRWHTDFEEPGIRSIDDRTIRISVPHVASTICLTRRWESLDVQYDVDVVTDWSGNPAPECAKN